MDQERDKDVICNSQEKQWNNWVSAKILFLVFLPCIPIVLSWKTLKGNRLNVNGRNIMTDFPRTPG